MSELEEIEKTLEGRKLTPQVRLSPSAINEYYRCPRCYYYRYIAKLKIAPNIHLIKGIIVHKVLEDFFRGYKSDMEKTAIDNFNKAWKANEQNIKDLEMEEDAVKQARTDCLVMITEYLETTKRKMQNLITAGKAENDVHAYYLIKPKFREMFVESKDLHCCGYIDRIHEDYNGLITIGDYKTSSKYGIGMPEDYVRQLGIYALLYKLKEQRMPDFVAVIFLRYGEEYLLRVDANLLRYARDIITEVWAKTRSTNLEDYPVATGTSSKWCPFLDIHDGGANFQAKLRAENMKKIIEESKNDIKRTDKGIL